MDYLALRFGHRRELDLRSHGVPYGGVCWWEGWGIGEEGTGELFITSPRYVLTMFGLVSIRLRRAPDGRCYGDIPFLSSRKDVGKTYESQGREPELGRAAARNMSRKTHPELFQRHCKFVVLSYFT